MHMHIRTYIHTYLNTKNKQSTCFNISPIEVDEDKDITEIRVTPHLGDYVVCLTLSAERFQEAEFLKSWLICAFDVVFLKWCFCFLP